jgi:hypothetical protein
MRCSAPGRVKTFQMSVVNAPVRRWRRAGGRGRRCRAGRGCRPCGCGGEGLDGDAGLGGDVLEAALAVLVLAEPVRVDAAVRGRGRPAEPGAGEELPDGPLAASGDAGDLARAVALAGEVAELVVIWWVRLGQGGAGLPGASWGAGWRAAVSRTWSAVVARRAAMARTGSPARMSGCRFSGLMPSGSGPGHVMPAAQSNGGFPGDGFVDCGAAPSRARAATAGPRRAPGRGEGRGCGPGRRRRGSGAGRRCRAGLPASRPGRLSGRGWPGPSG